MNEIQYGSGPNAFPPRFFEDRTIGELDEVSYSLSLI